MDRATVLPAVEPLPVVVGFFFSIAVGHFAAKWAATGLPLFRDENPDLEP
jgi:hypothetical protein